MSDPTPVNGSPTVVLVHGAFADASSWNGVIPLLLAKGVKVTAPPNPLRGISIDSAYIASVLAQTPGPVLAVGHSYGGAVISNAATDAKNVVGLVAACSWDHDQVEARLREALDRHGLQLFARIDHAAGARKADVDLEPDVLLIFGNTRVGTPLMQADPRVGIELPLRMLIWQDPDGTHVGYLDPRELADRYALDGCQQTLERQAAVLTKLGAAAAS